MSNTITPRTSKRKAAIIGCGIAGPVLAMGLRRAGIVSVIYEGRPEPGDDVGAFPGVAPNGRDVLATWEIRDEIDALGAPAPPIAFLNHKGKGLGETRSRSSIFGSLASFVGNLLHPRIATRKRWSKRCGGV